MYILYNLERERADRDEGRWINRLPSVYILLILLYYNCCVFSRTRRDAKCCLHAPPTRPRTAARPGPAAAQDPRTGAPAPRSPTLPVRPLPKLTFYFTCPPRLPVPPGFFRYRPSRYGGRGWSGFIPSVSRIVDFFFFFYNIFRTIKSIRLCL